MTHPLRVAENCTTHPLRKAQNLMTHPLSAPANPPLYFLTSPLQPFVRPVPRRLSLDENWRVKEGGKEKTGETALYPSLGPLRVATSHSRFARASFPNHAKNEAPEEEEEEVDPLFFVHKL